ncbi:MAG: thioredoxin family protein [Oscillospiraceae bacterium]|jgi:thioredoxin 1|nr:thioredoxin family protein [Oscillospiraceae bacterium]
MPVLVKPKEFDAEVVGAKIPVLVDFYGERCMPCRMQRPILVELSEQLQGQMKFCMFNTDRERQETDEDYEEKFRTIISYQVMNLPTLLLFVGGEVRRAMIGLHTKEELMEIFAEEGLHLTPRKLDEKNAEDGKDSGANQ